MDELWSHVGITWVQVGGVILATSVLYLVYAAVLKLWGQRIRASTSTFSLVLITIMGSLVARSMLGDAPTLLGGLTAISTLVVLETTFGVLRHRLSKKRTKRRHTPRVIVVEGDLRLDALKGARLTPHDLATRLRQQGVTSYSELALVLLESRGTLTIVRTGQRIDEELVWDVPGVRELPDSIIVRRHAS